MKKDPPKHRKRIGTFKSNQIENYKHQQNEEMMRRNQTQLYTWKA